MKKRGIIGSGRVVSCRVGLGRIVRLFQTGLMILFKCLSINASLKGEISATVDVKLL